MNFVKSGVFRKSIVTLLALATSTTILCQSAFASDSTTWLLHTGTLLEKSTSDTQFILGDYNRDGIPDLYVIEQKGGSNSTEVHVLDGSTNFQSWLLHTSTPLQQTDSNWEFRLGDYNRDGNLDLYAIDKNNTGSGKTEVHVLNGSGNFQSWLLHASTAMEETDSNVQFLVGDYNRDGYPDLYAIKKQGASSTEVHVMNGSNNFQTWLLHTGTPLQKTGSNWEYQLSDYNGDGYLDLYAIDKSGAGSATTEVHILGGNGNFQSWLLHTSSVLHETDSNWSFLLGQGKLTVYAINRQGASSTEVHVFGYRDISSYACSYTGTPYVWGGNTTSGWDCSGFTQYVMANYNLSLPHFAASQYQTGTAVSKSNLKPGDLVFFCTDGSTVSHVGIYIGNGNMVNAENSSVGTIVTSINTSYWTNCYVGARRLVYIP